MRENEEEKLAAEIDRQAERENELFGDYFEDETLSTLRKSVIMQSGTKKSKKKKKREPEQ